MIRNLLFDLDGTLVDSGPDVLASLEAAFAAASAAPARPLSAGCIGPPIAEIVAALSPGLSPERVAEVARRFRAIYDSSAMPRTRLMEGARETLISLVEAGKRIFLVTNKPMRPTLTVLARLALDGFSDIMTPDAVAGRRMRKPEMIASLLERHSLSSEETLFVGDTAEDVRAARENGIRAVVLTNGYGTAESLAATAPAYTYPRISGLLTMVLGRAPSDPG